MQLPAEQVSRLSQIAMAVKPEGFIADLVCPRVDAGGTKFKYTVLEKNDMFTIPDTKVGRKSEFNEVEFGSKLLDGSVEDWGLSDVVPDSDVQKADAGEINYRPLELAAEGTSLLVDLAREKRVADLYFSLNTYAANQRLTLSGTDLWDNTSSDPLAMIMDSLDTMLVRPNIAVFGRKTYTKLRRHPKIVAAVLNNDGQIHGGTGAAGYVSKRSLAELFEVDEIYVGETFYNSAKKGQAFSGARLWGNHAAFLRIDRNVAAPDRISLPTFAITAEFGKKTTRPVDMPNRGIRGSTQIIVAEQVKELITYQEGGFFFQNATS